MFRRLRTIISSTFFSRFFFLHIDAQYQVSFKSGNEKKLLKNQFPIQSSTLQENLINANNLSGIVRWSYLFFFLEMIFFYQPLSQREPNGFTGHLVTLEIHVRTLVNTTPESSFVLSNVSSRPTSLLWTKVNLNQT